MSEEEAYFLHIIYELFETPRTIDAKGHHNYNYIVDIKRAAMQRREREPENIKYSRINISFNPIDVQVGYVVVIRCSRGIGEIIHDRPYFAAITTSLDEAIKIQKEMQSKEEGGEDKWREFIQKKENYVGVEVIQPVLISER